MSSKWIWESGVVLALLYCAPIDTRKEVPLNKPDKPDRVETLIESKAEQREPLNHPKSEPVDRTKIRIVPMNRQPSEPTVQDKRPTEAPTALEARASAGEFFIQHAFLTVMGLSLSALVLFWFAGKNRRDPSDSDIQ